MRHAIIAAVLLCSCGSDPKQQPEPDPEPEQPVVTAELVAKADDGTKIGTVVWLSELEAEIWNRSELALVRVDIATGAVLNPAGEGDHHELRYQTPDCSGNAYRKLAFTCADRAGKSPLSRVFGEGGQMWKTQGVATSINEQASRRPGGACGSPRDTSPCVVLAQPHHSFPATFAVPIHI